jgi:hypothetical protein
MLLGRLKDRSQNNEAIKSPYIGLPGSVLIVCLYAVLSMAWVHSTPRDRMAMGFTILMTLSSFLAAYFVVDNKSESEMIHMMHIVSLLMSFIGLVYFLGALVSLGLREHMDLLGGPEEVARRVRGPLFGAANGYFILLPSIGLTLDRLTARKSSLVIDLTALSALLLATVGLRSRGAMLSLAVFCLFSTLTRRTTFTKLLWCTIAASCITVSAFFIFSETEAERVANLQDIERSGTHEVAFDIICSRGLYSLVGTGYGGVWSWYLPDVEDGGAYATNRFLISTPKGEVLFNPHSVMLMLVVELGVVGLLFAFKLLELPLYLVIVSWRRKYFTGLACGLVGSIPALFLDFPVFKYWPMSFFWWIYALGALRLIGGPLGNKSAVVTPREKSVIEDTS